MNEKYHIDDIQPSSRKYYKPQIIDAFFKENEARPYVWNCCYKRNFIIDNSLSFCENLDLGEDIVFQFGAFMAANSIMFINDKLYCYNFCTYSSANAMFLNNPAQRVKRHVAIVKEVEALYTKNSVKRDAQYARWILDFLFHDTMVLPKGDRESLIPIIKDLFNEIELKKLCRGVKDKLRRIIFVNQRWHYIYDCYNSLTFKKR